MHGPHAKLYMEKNARILGNNTRLSGCVNKIFTSMH